VACTAVGGASAHAFANNAQLFVTDYPAALP